MSQKITKKTQFTAIRDVLETAAAREIELPEGLDYTTLIEFVDHELALLDKKADAAQKRASEKRAAGDELREKILNVLSDTEFKSIDTILEDLADPAVRKNMVTARLGQLGPKGLGLVEKTQIAIPSEVEGEKARKATAYRRVVE